MRSISALTMAIDPQPASVGAPWAAALNSTAKVDAISLTLLAVDVVEDQLCLTGVLRMDDRPDLRLATVPRLQLLTLQGTSLLQVDARVMPRGRLAWMWWTFERPAIVPSQLEASISNIEFAFRAAPLSRANVEGPWCFSLLVTPPTPLPVAGRGEQGGAGH